MPWYLLPQIGPGVLEAVMTDPSERRFIYKNGRFKSGGIQWLHLHFEKNPEPEFSASNQEELYTDFNVEKSSCLDTAGYKSAIANRNSGIREATAKRKLEPLPLTRKDLSNLAVIPSI
jgi:hypothetical protein